MPQWKPLRVAIWYCFFFSLLFIYANFPKLLSVKVLKYKITTTDNDKVLSWIQRLEIAVDSARGLEFLHTYPGGCIVHRDIKVYTW